MSLTAEDLNSWRDRASRRTVTMAHGSGGKAMRDLVQQVMLRAFDNPLLAPDIQEALLFLPRVETGKSPIHEKMLRPIAAEMDWGRQRGMWGEVLKT